MLESTQKVGLNYTKKSANKVARDHTKSVQARQQKNKG